MEEEFSYLTRKEKKIMRSLLSKVAVGLVFVFGGGLWAASAVADDVAHKVVIH